jgi:glucose/arabinose dehydrogenase
MNGGFLVIVYCLLSFIILTPLFTESFHTTAESEPSIESPSVVDSALELQVVTEGIKLGTNLAFLSADVILVLERWDGTVRKVVDGKLLQEPVLDVNVAKHDGMLGISVGQVDEGNDESGKLVFLYYTETDNKDLEDDLEGKAALGNHVYRYELSDGEQQLVNPQLLLRLPATPGPYHHGGDIAMGPDNNVYITVGDIDAKGTDRTQADNKRDGKEADGRSGILRVTQEGQTVRGILGNDDPLDKYFAYGIRNSFGIDFDPVTGYLWDTENGPSFGDEINLVSPGFNSGWSRIQGVWEAHGEEKGQLIQEPRGLVNFNGSGIYSEPEFIWDIPVGVSAIKFLDSDKLGPQYENDLFVADSNYGNIYHFNLSKNRTELVLNDPLEDKIAQNPKELNEVIFGHGFGVITDLEVGPDGNLYVLTYDEVDGAIYKIHHRDSF